MKKIFIILFTLFLFIFICNNVNSQQIYFNNRYDYKQGLEVAWSVLEIDSGYIIAGGGYGAGIGSYTGIVIVQMDFNGDTLWKKFYGKPDFAYYAGRSGSFIPTADGGFALGGTITDTSGNANALLIKFDQNGDTLWTKIYNNSDFDTGYNCRQTNNGGFILTGYTTSAGNNNLDFYLIKTDSLGNIEWQRAYGGSNIEKAFSVEQTQDGGFILGGGTNSFGVGDYDTYIIKVDSLGDVQWNKTFGGIYSDNAAFIIPTSDGGYILSTQIGRYKNGSKTYKQTRIIKLFNNGSVEWDKTYGPVNYLQGLGPIYELNNGDFIAIGQKPDANGYPIGFLFKINSQGDSIWWKEYELLTGNNSQNYLRDVKPTSDGGYIACGFVVPGTPDTGIQDMWVIKLDSCGCAFPDCDTICTALNNIGIEDKVSKNSANVKIYPNPASKSVTITYKLPGNTKDAALDVYNVIGTKILGYKINNEQGRLNLDISNLPDGLYFYTITVNNNTIARDKLIIAK